MKRDVLLYLSDIIENMRDAEQFIGIRTFEAFRSDKMAVNAVLRSLEVIGEATKNVPEDIRNRRPGVPWRNMARMRDRVIHIYFGVDYTRVWEAVKDVIPTVRPEIESLLKDLQSEENAKTP
jgi:uncharacterized protein with HEPN domain